MRKLIEAERMLWYHRNGGEFNDVGHYHMHIFQDMQETVLDGLRVVMKRL